MGAKAAKTVIYVEDEPAVQRLVAFWLEDAGFRVLVAGDGAEGMDLIRATLPDLVVTDALMPILTGDELVERLQADPALSHIPIVMATAAASPIRVQRMLSLGCKAVVAKPLDEDTFLHAVHAALG